MECSELISCFMFADRRGLADLLRMFCPTPRQAFSFHSNFSGSFPSHSLPLSLSISQRSYHLAAVARGQRHFSKTTLVNRSRSVFLFSASMRVVPFHLLAGRLKFILFTRRINKVFCNAPGVMPLLTPYGYGI